VFMAHLIPSPAYPFRSQLRALVHQAVAGLSCRAAGPFRTGPRSRPIHDGRTAAVGGDTQ